MKLIIINGPNLNLLGIREKNIYGDTSFDSYYKSLLKKFEGIISNTEIPLHNGSKIRFMNMPMPEEPLENEEIDNQQIEKLLINHIS